MMTLQLWRNGTNTGINFSSLEDLIDDHKKTMGETFAQVCNGYADGVVDGLEVVAALNKEYAASGRRVVLLDRKRVGVPHFPVVGAVVTKPAGERTIAEARIVHPNGLGESEIFVRWSDAAPGIEGTPDHLFNYYADEISFSTEEFVGLTRSAASELRIKKDVAYLQS